MQSESGGLNKYFIETLAFTKKFFHVEIKSTKGYKARE